MPRVIGVDIPPNKRLEIALTYIYGVGRVTAQKICVELKLDPGIRARDLNEDQITVIDPVYLTGPWTWTYKYVRRKDYKINEYVCEDNRLYLDPATGQQKLRLGE